MTLPAYHVPLQNASKSFIKSLSFRRKKFQKNSFWGFTFLKELDIIIESEFLQAWRNWQTRTVQVRVKAISWRFESSCLHHTECSYRTRKVFKGTRSFIAFLTCLKSAVNSCALPCMYDPFIIQILLCIRVSLCRFKA